MTTDTNNTAQTDADSRPAGAGPVQRSVSGLPSVAVLFARQDSYYKTLPGCDVWDIERDARNWPGGAPVVAHPPCRAWGQYAHVAKPRAGEKELALFAVEQIRRYGGVLEHPKKSRLFHDVLPKPGCVDEFGGWTLPIMQHWFGHRAEKATYLYLCGIRHFDVPPMHFKLGGATHVIGQGRQARPDLGRGRLKKGMVGWRPEVTPREREHTPPELARWLVELAGRCKPANVNSATPPVA